MTNLIKSDFQLDQLCNGYAQDIIWDAKSYAPENWLEYVTENANDLAHDWADGSEHVIYHYYALQICANCNTDYGSEFVEDIGTVYSDINKLASAIAYGEIYSRVMQHLQNALDMLAEHDDVAVGA